MGNQCGACLGISVKRTGLRKEYRARSLQKDLDDDRSCDTWQNRREALYQQQRAKIESKCSRAEPEVPVSFVSESWLAQSRMVAESQRVALEALLHERENVQKALPNDRLVESNQENEEVIGSKILHGLSKQFDSPNLHAIEPSVAIDPDDRNHETDTCPFSDSDHTNDDDSKLTFSQDLNGSSGDIKGISQDLNGSLSDMKTISMNSTPSVLNFASVDLSPDSEWRVLPTYLSSIAGPALFDKREAPTAPDQGSFDLDQAKEAKSANDLSAPAALLPAGPAPLEVQPAELSPHSVRVLHALLGGAAGARVLVHRIVAGPVAGQGR